MRPPHQEVPAVIEIKVTWKGHEFTVMRTQEFRLGRPIESVTETMRAAAGDAQAWIRRQR